MLHDKIPDQMTAVILGSYTGVDALRIERRPVPQPGSNEVLVKVAATASGGDLVEYYIDDEEEGKMG